MQNRRLGNIYYFRGGQNISTRGRGGFPPAPFVQQPQDYQQDDGNSVAQMENSLKKMLNISANNQTSGNKISSFILVCLHLCITYRQIFLQRTFNATTNTPIQ